jgi:hypothetical protein
LIRRLLALALLVPSLCWATCDTDSYSHIICADSPTHYYRLDESSGTAAGDIGTASHINGVYHGTYSLSATGVPAVTDKAINFTGAGADGYIGYTNNSDFNVSSTSGAGWSHELWVKPSVLATNEYFAAMSATPPDPDYPSWHILTSTTTLRFTIFKDAGGGQCSGVYGNTGFLGTLTTGTFHHVVVTTLGAGSSQLTRMRLYLDAVLLSTVTSFSGTVCPNNFTACDGTSCDGIGLSLGNNTQGIMDETAFYKDTGSGSGELTQAQVTAHYNAGLIAGFGQSFPFSVKREMRKPWLVGWSYPTEYTDGQNLRKRWENVMIGKLQETSDLEARRKRNARIFEQRGEDPALAWAQ